MSERQTAAEAAAREGLLRIARHGDGYSRDAALNTLQAMDRPLDQRAPEMVTVPKESLRLLYECAKSYDRRVPFDSQYGWAISFIEMFESRHTETRR